MKFSEKQELRREGFCHGMARAEELLRGRHEAARAVLLFTVVWDTEARKAYPVTRTVTRPREVYLDSGGGRYRFRDGVLEYETILGDWRPSDNLTEAWSPSDLRTLADLMENPTETVLTEEVAE